MLGLWYKLYSPTAYICKLLVHAYSVVYFVRHLRERLTEIATHGISGPIASAPSAVL